VSLSGFRKWTALSLLTFAVMAAATPGALAENRKVKSQVNPIYPELARRMNVTGKVKLEIVVSPSGEVKSVKALGGHPLLIDSATTAVKKWKFEPAPTETTETREFNFSSTE